MNVLIALAWIVGFFILQIILAIPLNLWQKKSLAREMERLSLEYSAKLGRTINLNADGPDDLEALQVLRDSTYERMNSDQFSNRIANLAGYISIAISWITIIISYGFVIYGAYLFAFDGGEALVFTVSGFLIMTIGSITHFAFALITKLFTGRLPGQPAKSMSLLEEIDSKIILLNESEANQEK